MDLINGNVYVYIVMCYDGNDRARLRLERLMVPKSTAGVDAFASKVGELNCRFKEEV